MPERADQRKRREESWAAAAVAVGYGRPLRDVRWTKWRQESGRPALDWLETAMRNRDPYLAYTKVNPFFDPLRSEPRFQAIELALKFPD